MHSNPLAKCHLDAHANYFFRFGCYGKGIKLRSDLKIFYGTSTYHFNEDSSFGFKPMEEVTKRVVIYQLRRKNGQQ